MECWLDNAKQMMKDIFINLTTRLLQTQLNRKTQMWTSDNKRTCFWGTLKNNGHNSLGLSQLLTSAAYQCC